tara:strand:+ start:14776 stop:15201 length:426 start_codon:yes stop_codon:yes gene_type:complete
MIEQSPSFGYRTVAWLLGLNKNTVRRIFQLKGWQVKKRAIGFRPRIQALVIDCHTRELLGRHLSRSGKASTATRALERALISRYGTLDQRCQTISISVRQWACFYEPQLYRVGAWLRLAAGVHYTALPTAKRDGRTCESYA